MAEIGERAPIIPGRGNRMSASHSSHSSQSRDMVVALAVSVLASVSAGNLGRCAQWRRAQGIEKAALANQLGATNHLTKNQRLAEAQPGETQSLYRISDLQRLCRTP